MFVLTFKCIKELFRWMFSINFPIYYYKIFFCDSWVVFLYQNVKHEQNNLSDLMHFSLQCNRTSVYGWIYFLYQNSLFFSEYNMILPPRYNNLFHVWEQLLNPIRNYIGFIRRNFLRHKVSINSSTFASLSKEPSISF